MAYSLIPSTRWQEILDITDEKEQGVAATKYVCSLENEVRILKAKQDDIKKETYTYLVEIFMKTKPFSDWLKDHDDKIRNDVHDSYKDWSGIQGGF